MRCFTAVESRERFEARVVIVPNGCHIWTGCVTGHGYGTLVRDQKQWKAHRFAWTLYRGPIPEGMHVLHHCDVPPCVNPEHLWLGTHTENIQDMDRKGRRARSGIAKLSDD